MAEGGYYSIRMAPRFGHLSFQSAFKKNKNPVHPSFLFVTFTAWITKGTEKSKW